MDTLTHIDFPIHPLDPKLIGPDGLADRLLGSLSREFAVRPEFVELYREYTTAMLAG